MGELSKSEITSLEESLKYLLKENKRNEKISSAIKPKIIQLIGIIAIFIIGTITIIPCIQNMCNSLDSAIALPWITTAINSLLKVWYYPAIILILVILAIRIYLFIVIFVYLLCKNIILYYTYNIDTHTHINI